MRDFTIIWLKLWHKTCRNDKQSSVEFRTSVWLSTSLEKSSTVQKKRHSLTKNIWDGSVLIREMSPLSSYLVLNVFSYWIPFTNTEHFGEITHLNFRLNRNKNKWHGSLFVIRLSQFRCKLWWQLFTLTIWIRLHFDYCSHDEKSEGYATISIVRLGMNTSISLLKAKLHSNKYKHLRRRTWLTEMSTHTGINIPEINEELKMFLKFEFFNVSRMSAQCIWTRTKYYPDESSFWSNASNGRALIATVSGVAGTNPSRSTHTEKNIALSLKKLCCHNYFDIAQN